MRKNMQLINYNKRRVSFLIGKTIKFSAPEAASTDLAPDEDGFMIVYYRPEDSSSIVSITTYDNTSNIIIGAGISQGGARIAYTVPVVAGRSYRTDRSLARGTLTAHFMPIH